MRDERDAEWGMMDAGELLVMETRQSVLDSRCEQRAASSKERGARSAVRGARCQLDARDAGHQMLCARCKILGCYQVR
eukprot:2748002-Rhodomonas_salina.3